MQTAPITDGNGKSPWYQRFPKAEKFIQITLHPNGPLPIKSFHCNSCGRMIFKHSFEMVNGFEGKVLESPNFIEMLCERCNVLYRIDFI